MAANPHWIDQIGLGPIRVNILFWIQNFKRKSNHYFFGAIITKKKKKQKNTFVYYFTNFEISLEGVMKVLRCIYITTVQCGRQFGLKLFGAIGCSDPPAFVRVRLRSWSERQFVRLLLPCKRGFRGLSSPLVLVFFKTILE